MVPVRPLALSSFRFLSTNAEKPPLKLVAELRKLTEVSITKAREALATSNNDLSAALNWLQNDLAVSGAKKADKIAHRTAGESLVSASVLSRGTGSSPGGFRAALVELIYETVCGAQCTLRMSRRRRGAYRRVPCGIGLEPGRTISTRAREDVLYIHPVPRDRLLDVPLLSAEGKLG
jgi:hypothetical protein